MAGYSPLVHKESEKTEVNECAHTHTHTHTYIYIYFIIHGSQPCLGEGACVTQWSYEHAMQGHPTWMGHSEEFWQNMVQLEEEIATHSSILAWRTPWTVWKIKRIWHWKMSPTGQNMPIMLLGKSGEQQQIAQRRMKWLGQSGNDTLLWMCLVWEYKVQCYEEQFCKDLWSR